MSCQFCNDTKAETRPYGPKGEAICYKCAFTPERKAHTESMYKAQIDAIEGPVLIGLECGPIPATKENMESADGKVLQ